MCGHEMDEHLDRKIRELTLEHLERERERQIRADRGERLFRAWARWQPHIPAPGAERWRGRF